MDFYGFTLYMIFAIFLKMAIPIMTIFVKNSKKTYKVGCVFPMVVVFILHHVEFGPNGLREDAPHFLGRILKNSRIYPYYNFGDSPSEMTIWVKGSSDPSYFIFELYGGNSRIRHVTTLNLNDIIFNRFWVDLAIHDLIWASLSVESDSFRPWFQK